MGPTEIKVGGLGGQGVILGGIIIGKAAALFDGKHSCLTQAFGPEARGSACSVSWSVASRVVNDTPWPKCSRAAAWADCRLLA